MRITAVDLTHKKFTRGFRGYKTAEVDDLLREIASQLEETARDRARLEDQIESLRSEMARYKEMENTLNNAILLAQRTADEMQTSARRDADFIIRQAEQKAAQLTDEAHNQRQELFNEIRRLAERRSMLIDQLRGASRDLEDWLQHRRFEEVVALGVPGTEPVDRGDNTVQTAIIEDEAVGGTEDDAVITNEAAEQQ